MSRPDTPFHHRARVARAVRFGDEAEAEAARRDLKAANAEQYIRQLVAEAPPLSESQRARLAALFSPAGTDEQVPA